MEILFEHSKQIVLFNCQLKIVYTYFIIFHGVHVNMTKICKYDHSEIKMFVSLVHFPRMYSPGYMSQVRLTPRLNKVIGHQLNKQKNGIFIIRIYNLFWDIIFVRTIFL